MPFEAVTTEDLALLARLGVPEGQQLEYKRELWASSRDGYKELLKDVSAFANADGGDLIVGLDEREEEPHALTGLRVDKPDEVLRGLQDQLAAGLEPPVASLRMRWIPLDEERRALLLRVPSSLAGPHRSVVTKDFHIRSNTMATPMSVHQLRDAFVGAERLIERLRARHHAVFERERPELPFPRSSEATAVVSLFPLDVLRARRDLDVTFNSAVKPSMHRAGGMDWHIMLEGLAYNAGINRAVAYTVTHREGWLEAAWEVGGLISSGPVQNQRLVFKDLFEDELARLVTDAQGVFRGHGIDGPWIVMTSLIGIGGYQIAKPEIGLTAATPRTLAHLPDVGGETIDRDALLPVFKAFWRVFGLERPA